MPIKYISKFAKTNNLFVDTEIQDGQTFIIDFQSLLFNIYIKNLNFSFNGNTEILYEEILGFTELLNDHQCSYQVIGSLDDQDVDFEEYKNLIQSLNEDWSDHISASEQGFRFDSQAISIAVSALRQQKVSVVFVEGPAYKYVISQANKIEDSAILGYDSVYLGTDVKFYFIDSLYEDKEGKLHCSVGSGAAIREKLQLSVEQYQILLSLLPNHVQPENQLQYFFKDLSEQESEQIDPMNRCIINLAQFIKDNENQDLTQKLLEKEKEGLMKARGKIEQEIDKYKQQKQDFEQKTKETESLPKSPANIKRIQGFQQNIQVCIEQIEKLQVQLDDMKEENVNVDLTIVHQLFDQLNLDQSLKEKLVPEAPYVNNFIKQGKVSQYIYHALKQQKVQLNPEFEPLDKEASCLVSKKLRGILYGLLNLKEIKELVKGEKDMIETTNQAIDCGLIQNYVKLPTQQRKKLVIQWIISSNPNKPTDLEKQIIDLLLGQQNWIQFAIILYILQNVDIEEDQLFAAFLTSILFPITERTLQKAKQTHQLNRSKNSCFLASQINNVCREIYNLSNMMGLTVDLSKVFIAPKLHIQYDQEKDKCSMIFQLSDIIQDSERLFQILNDQKLSLTDKQLVENKENYEFLLKLIDLIPQLSDKWNKLIQDYQNENQQQDTEEQVEQVQQSNTTTTSEQQDDFGGLILN